MTDARLVTSELLGRVIKERATGGGDSNALEALAAREPVLAVYVSERLVATSGRLALSGAPPEVVRGCYEEILDVVVVALRAVWAGHDELWKGVDLEFLGLAGARLKRRRVRTRSGVDGGMAGPERQAAAPPAPHGGAA